MKMKIAERKRSRRHVSASAGFTLIEMVLVLAIIALLVGGAIGVLSGVREEGKRIRIMGDFRAMESALTIYESRCLRLPNTNQGLKSLVVKPTTAPVPTNWGQQMRKVPLDPYGQEYGYRYPGTKNTDRFDLISAGQDGLFDTADDLGNWDVE
jgi:general secretion pathway protein G